VLNVLGEGKQSIKAPRGGGENECGWSGNQKPPRGGAPHRVNSDQKKLGSWDKPVKTGVRESLVLMAEKERKSG